MVATDDEPKQQQSVGMADIIGTDRPILMVDFNELIEANLVLLSQHDRKLDTSGRPVELREGLAIAIFCDDDLDDDGNVDPMFAKGVVELNSLGGWAAHVKWCCRIDEEGIRRLSDTCNDKKTER